MKWIRVDFSLGEKAKEKIREVAFKKRISEAELYRQAITKYLNNEAKNEKD